MRSELICMGLVLVLAGCSPGGQGSGQGSDEAAADEAGPPAEQVAPRDPYTHALEADRLEGDAGRDADRKPAEVIRFFGIEPGMKVLDLFSGGGYYTEYLSHLLGREGEVTSHNNQAYLGFAAAELEQRYADGRLGDVIRLIEEAQGIDLRDGHYDAALLILAFHDLYYVQEEYGWPAIDADAFLAEVYASLAPGGILGVVDHAALDGTGPDAAQNEHRIDQAFLIAVLERAGFVLEAESDLLRNPDDPRTHAVFDAEIKGRTDRFVLRFRKPAAPEAEPVADDAG